MVLTWDDRYGFHPASSRERAVAAAMARDISAGQA
jgi:hypothetical protein